MPGVDLGLKTVQIADFAVLPGSTPARLAFRPRLQSFHIRIWGGPSEVPASAEISTGAV